MGLDPNTSNTKENSKIDNINDVEIDTSKLPFDCSGNSNLNNDSKNNNINNELIKNQTYH